MPSRREKLIALREMYNLETAKRKHKAFADIDEFFVRSAAKAKLDKEIRNCNLCEGMNEPMSTEAAPGYGYVCSKIFIIGQSLCKACMATQIPFTYGSGYFLDAALILAGLKRKDIYVTNIVHCHPLSNRKSETHEITNCLPYLIRELLIVKPAIVVNFGADARETFAKLPRKLRKEFKTHNVKHPAYFLHKGLDGVIDWIVNLATILEKYND